MRETIPIKKEVQIEKPKLAKKEIVESFKPKKQTDNTTETYVCKDAENCDIDKITSFLIKKGKEKDYPNITNE